MRQKQANFYLSLRQEEKARRKSGTAKLRLRIAVAAAVALCCVAALAVTVGATLSLQRQLNAIDAWCYDDANLSAYEESLVNCQLADLYSARLAAVESDAATRKTYPRLDDAIFDRIRAAGADQISVTFVSYDAASGVLAFDARSPLVIDIPAYVRALESTGLFASVSYSGYSRESGVYSINVRCVLDAPNEEG